MSGMRLENEKVCIEQNKLKYRQTDGLKVLRTNSFSLSV